MKKLTYIALAALLALCACSKMEQDGVQTGRKISFSMGSYVVSTKADTTGVSGITTYFRSRAFLHAYGVAGTQDFFGPGEGEKIAFDGSRTWSPGADSGYDYFWPFNAQSYINFVCWYDRNGAPDTATLSETSLSWTDRTIVANDEILVADEAWRFNDNEHRKYGVEADFGVPVLFHHALAQVAFRGQIKDNSTTGSTSDYILSASGKTKWEITLESASLSGVYQAGSLALTNADPSTGYTTVAWTSATDGLWTPKAGTDATVTLLSTPTKLGVSAVNLLETTTVLPQEVSADMVLTFTYTIHTYHRASLDAAFSATAHSAETARFSQRLGDVTPMITEWPMGKRTIYTIVIDPSTGTILFDPTLEDWNSSIGGGTVTLE